MRCLWICTTIILFKQVCVIDVLRYCALLKHSFLTSDTTLVAGISNTSFTRRTTCDIRERWGTDWDLTHFCIFWKVGNFQYIGFPYDWTSNHCRSGGRCKRQDKLKCRCSGFRCPHQGSLMLKLQAAPPLYCLDSKLLLIIVLLMHMSLYGHLYSHVAIHSVHPHWCFPVSCCTQVISGSQAIKTCFLSHSLSCSMFHVLTVLFLTVLFWSESLFWTLLENGTCILSNEYFMKLH